MTDVAAPSMPRINEPAPAFKAKTTHGERSLDDYKGKWLVLFSHPADFTPVCTTEFMGFAKAADRFKALNCELLGLSIDSVHSHIAWMRSIEEKFGVEIPFPIIDDLSMNVAKAFGMIHPGASDTSAVRATFLIDPEGVILFLEVTAEGIGRNAVELLRKVKAAQYVAAHPGEVCPAKWEEGEATLAPSLDLVGKI